MLGNLPGTGPIQDVAIKGNYAYLASSTFGLTVVDISSIAAQRVVANSEVAFNATKIAVGGTRVVVGGATSANLAHLWVFDISTPTQPTLIAEIDTTLIPAGIFDLAVNSSGTTAAYAKGGAGVAVINLSNLAVGTFDTAGIAYSIAFSSSGTVVYVADGSGGIKVINVATPTAPVQIGSLAISGIQRDIAVSNNVAYLADQMGRLVTVDVGTPTAPTQLGALVIGRYTFNVAVEGNRAIVHDADTTAYLDVIDISNPAAPALIPGSSGVGVDAAGAIKGLAYTNARAFVAYATTAASGLKTYSVGTLTTLVSHLRDEFIASRVAGGHTTAVVTGANIATNTARLIAVSTLNPASPEILGQLSSTLTPAAFMDVAINETARVAVIATGGNGIWIVDLIDPSNPTRRSIFDTSGIAYAVVLNSAGTIAYVADGSGGLKIISLSDLANPSQLASLTVGGILRDIAVWNNKAFLADQMGRLVIADVATPTAPVQLSAYTIGRYTYNVASEGSRVITHSADSIAYLDVFDSSNPTAPVRLTPTGIAIDAAGGVKGLALAYGHAFVANNTNGLKIYSLADPASPALSGSGYRVGSTVDVWKSGEFVYIADTASVMNIIDLFANP